MDAKRIGDLLIEAGVLSRAGLAEVLDREMMEGQGRIASAIADLGLAHERQLCDALARGAGHPALVLSQSTLDLSALALIPEVVATAHALLPVALDDTTVTLAVADVDSRPVFEQVSFVTGRRVTLLLAVEPLLTSTILAAYAAERRGEPLLIGQASAADDHAHLELARPAVDEDALEALVGQLVDDEPPLLSHNVQTPLAQLVGQRTAGEGRPVARLALKKKVVAAPASAALPPEPARDKRQPVLVVEDDSSVRDLLRRSLGHDGHPVLTAASGTEAVERLRERRPALVVLDAMLPGMHGFELCARLKASASYRDVPVVMISAVYRGWSQAREIQEVHGADAFVEKPFDVRYVRRLVAQLLGRPLDPAPAPEKRSAHLEAIRTRVLELSRAGAWQAALDEASHWLEADPFDPVAHLEVGNLRSQLDDLEGALRAYEHATVYGPSLFAAHANLAVVYDRLGFARKSADSWRRARELTRNDAARARIDARLTG